MSQAETAVTAPRKKKRYAPRLTEFQYYLLRALLKGEKLFVRQYKRTPTAGWFFGEDQIQNSPRKPVLISDVDMTGDMEPDLHCVKYLAHYGWLQQEGERFLPTQQAIDLVASKQVTRNDAETG